MSEIENLGVSVEEYLDGLAAGIDILELKRLEARGIPTNLALEVIAIANVSHAVEMTANLLLGYLHLDC
ncbi:hypothetical protein [Nostoc sp. CHAB 5715]|uniref:hypothetical protein n=1 Tax=Nostoc sp. CHAB 5715 TaxID=2780400 RepID=UPI001E50E04B|nr:hypothetical protein [Nostoc sp. CHAB 5715]MCC5622835.1 hypothetical protein [Nostoc sp. CHAB 5715]